MKVIPFQESSFLNGSLCVTALGVSQRPRRPNVAASSYITGTKYLSPSSVDMLLGGVLAVSLRGGARAQYHPARRPHAPDVAPLLGMFVSFFGAVGCEVVITSFVTVQ